MMTVHGGACFSALFDAALHAVAEDVPEGHEQLIGALGSLVLEVRVGAERFFLADGRVGPVAERTADVRLAVAATDLVRLLDGETTLTSELAHDRLELVGRVEHLAQIDQVLLLLLHGVLRSSRAPGLMRSLRSLSQSES